MTLVNPFRIARPCQICGEQRRKCREIEIEYKSVKTTMHLCMNQEGDQTEFKYLGKTSDPDQLWSKYLSWHVVEQLSIKSNSNARFENRNSKPLKQSRQKEKPALDLLSIPNRHKAIQALINQLELSHEHKTRIKARGFSQDLIDYHQFKSVKYLQPLTLAISSKLAGVAINGRELTNRYNGILIPIRNHKNMYLGWQTRLDSGKLRYLWPKSHRATAHLAEYPPELPLAYIQPKSLIDTDTAGLVEGIGFKAMYTANHFQQIVIGASSGHFASSPQQFHQYLTHIRDQYGINHLILYPDKGAVIDRQVIPRYQKAYQLVLEQGFVMSVAWWGQITKSQTDIDEFSGDIDLITPQQFWNIAEKYQIRTG